MASKHEADLAKMEKHYFLEYKNSFDEGFLYAPNQYYFIEDYQKKIGSFQFKLQEKSNLGPKLQEIKFAMQLDTRINLVQSITEYCKINKRNIQNALRYMAQMTAFDQLRSTLFDMSRSIAALNILPAIATVLPENEASNLTAPNLAGLFADPQKYDIVIAQLIDHEFCSKNPLTWIIRDKGRKEILCALMYNLLRKGYFNFLEFPTPALLSLITKNTFGINISASTFKIKNTDKYISRFEFIKKVTF